MREHMSYQESVKMLRDALKRNFPGVKFSVAKSYGRGTTVSVNYQFGPTVEDVDRIAQRFSGKDFDGMTDSTLYPTAILVGSDGEMREVCHGVGYIFVRRNTPDAYLAATVSELAKLWCPEQWNAMQPWDRERMALPGVSKLATSESESPEDFAKRAVRVILDGPAVLS